MTKTLIRFLVLSCFFSCLLIKGSHIKNWDDLLGEPKSSSWNPTNFFGKQQIGSEKLTSGNLTKKQWRKCKSVVDRCCLRPPLFHSLSWENQWKTCCLPWDNWGPTCWDTRILGYWSRSPRGWPQVRRDPERGLQSWFRPAKPETRNPKPENDSEDLTSP